MDGKGNLGEGQEDKEIENPAKRAILPYSSESWGGRRRIEMANLSKISFQPVISYITTVISTCSFLSHDYVHPYF